MMAFGFSPLSASLRSAPPPLKVGRKGTYSPQKAPFLAPFRGRGGLRSRSERGTGQKQGGAA
jgi:hypothetical protein